MTYLRTMIAVAAMAFAGAAHAQTPHGPSQGAPSGSRTVDIQGPQGAFADKERMTAFYQILLEAHNQGDKADLPVMETRVKALAQEMFGGGKPLSKAMEDHVLGIAHQALAMGVSNPKIFASYDSFMAEMMGPR